MCAVALSCRNQGFRDFQKKCFSIVEKETPLNIEVFCACVGGLAPPNQLAHSWSGDGSLGHDWSIPLRHLFFKTFWLEPFTRFSETLVRSPRLLSLSLRALSLNTGSSSFDDNFGWPEPTVRASVLLRLHYKPLFLIATKLLVTFLLFRSSNIPCCLIPTVRRGRYLPQKNSVCSRKRFENRVSVPRAMYSTVQVWSFPEEIQEWGHCLRAMWSTVYGGWFR